MQDGIYDIEDMPTLAKRLGKRKVARIKYAQSGATKPSNRERVTPNTIIDLMQGRSHSDPFCEISDIVAGVARLDHYANKGRNVPLSTASLYGILQCIEEVCPTEVMSYLGVGKRQAQVYCKACKLIISQVEKELPSYDVNDPIIESGISDLDYMDC